MTTQRSDELGNEVDESPLPDRHLEGLDDIPREIAERRLHAEFAEHLAPEHRKSLREVPDHLEKPDDFAESARQAGIEDTEDVLGYATDLESPAHVLKGDVGQEIATLIHEDLHRLSHPETLREMAIDPARRDLYEGVTEHLTSQAADGLHGFHPGEVYPEQTEAARALAAEVGEVPIRDWFFKHEVTEELQRALDRLPSKPEQRR